MRYILLLLLPALLQLGACSPREQPITETEAVAFGRSLQSAISAKSVKLFKDMIHTDAFARKVAEASSEKVNAAYLNGVKQGLEKKNFAMEILKNIGANGVYDFIRYYKKDNKHHLLFRLYGDGLNYHDMELIKMNDKIQVADIYLYTSGENISKSIAMMLDAIDGATAGDAPEITAYASSITKIKNLMHEGEYAKARDTYQALPRRLKQNKMLMILNLQVCGNLSSEEYMAAMEEFETLYKDDPGIQLMLLDGYFLRKDYTAALNAVNTLDASVKDPMLDFYRALVYKQMEDRDQAIAVLERLYRNMPGFADGVIELIAAQLENRNEKRAAELVNAYKANTTLPQDKLVTISILYPAFAEKTGLAEKETGL